MELLRILRSTLVYCLLACIPLFGNIPLFAQETVNSLTALKPYLDDDNVVIKLAPGLYEITTQDIKDGKYSDRTFNDKHVLFHFTGNKSSYDFTGVTIQVETKVARAFSRESVYQINVAGNGNVISNLTLRDQGNVDDEPKRNTVNVVVDGRNNTIQGFKVYSQGSKPYGYGDLFGKGAGSLIPLFKHSCILIRGTGNTLKDTKIFHQAFGHCVFFQAGHDITVDNCHIVSKMRTTDSILNENKTIASKLKFMTQWGYKIPKGYAISLGEAGIRAYNAGTTFIDGEVINRGTHNVTIKNTIVKNTRAGCTLSHATGKKVVTNCTLIGNESGYNIGSGTITNCRADAAYGSVFDNGHGVTGDITLIKPEKGYYNGSKTIASITGADLILKTDGHIIPRELKIRMGTHRTIRHQLGGNLEYQLTKKFTGSTFYNHTKAEVEIGPDASDNTIYTNSRVSDKSSRNNNVSRLKSRLKAL